LINELRGEETVHVSEYVTLLPIELERTGTENISNVGSDVEDASAREIKEL
jgi:hypothetical protein